MTTIQGYIYQYATKTYNMSNWLIYAYMYSENKCQDQQNVKKISMLFNSRKNKNSTNNKKLCIYEIIMGKDKYATLIIVWLDDCVIFRVSLLYINFVQ